MRLVIDTNVLVSGMLNPHGVPGRIIEAIGRGVVAVLYDDRILSEYGEVLRRPRFELRPADVEGLLELVTVAGEFVIAQPLRITLPDETDLPFLEVAIAGYADALI